MRQGKPKTHTLPPPTITAEATRPKPNGGNGAAAPK
jgi:hypothetical protein